MGIDCGGFFLGTDLIETVVDRFGNRQYYQSSYQGHELVMNIKR